MKKTKTTPKVIYVEEPSDEKDSVVVDSEKLPGSTVSVDSTAVVPRLMSPPRMRYLPTGDCKYYDEVGITTSPGSAAGFFACINPLAAGADNMNRLGREAVCSRVHLKWHCIPNVSGIDFMRVILFVDAASNTSLPNMNELLDSTISNPIYRRVNKASQYRNLRVLFDWTSPLLSLATAGEPAPYHGSVTVNVPKRNRVSHWYDSSSMTPTTNSLGIFIVNYGTGPSALAAMNWSTRVEFKDA